MFVTELNRNYWEARLAFFCQVWWASQFWDTQKLSYALAPSHCAFSSNLFHGHLAQIYIDQLSDPENKKCRPWKVFGKNHPQTPRLLSRRGPRSAEARLSQHYIGPKMTFQHFSNFCRKKFLGLIKGISCTYWMNLEVLPHYFFKLQPLKLKKMCRSLFVQPGNFFLQKFEKCWNVILEPM